MKETPIREKLIGMEEGLDHCYAQCLCELVLGSSHVRADSSEQLVSFFFAGRGEPALQSSISDAWLYRYGFA